jgi:asparagine synthase (glutamine-hydrolysing)
MCGIAGEFSYGASAPRINVEALTRVREAMWRRGPDGFGQWISSDQSIGFAHRRLSIIDLAARSDQPLHRASGDAVLVFNGEIYNYKQLRAELQAAGAALQTEGDSEVVLELLTREGAGALKKLRGMYALGFYDARSQTLILARDPYGIKPLYYADQNGRISFASSVKALAQHGELSCQVDIAAKIGFMMYGSIPEPLSSLSVVQALPPGNVFVIKRGHAPELFRVQSLADLYSMSSIKLDGRAPSSAKRGRQTSATQELVQASLLDSVRAHLEADVEVGAFLSAGVDSGALVGLMRDCGAKSIKTMTIRFSEFANQSVDEGVLAAKVAKLYGAMHAEHFVNAEEFIADFPAFMAAMDQPSIDGMNTWMVSKAVHALGLKVALSGLGGDELIGGYGSFADIPRWQRRFGWLAKMPAARGFGQLLAPIARNFGLHPKAVGMFEFAGSLQGLYLLRRGLFLPSELGEFFEPEELLVGLQKLLQATQSAWAIPDSLRDSFAQVSYMESSRYMRNQLLRDTDWASMAHSLEVRVPLVDATLLAALMPQREWLQTLGGKRLLGSAPSTPLPDEIINRSKTGFTTPVSAWQQSLPELCGWKKYSSLQAKHTPWARRYAAALLEIAF